MSEPDIEKKRKKRRRSARVYLSNAHPLPSPEQLAALVDQFPSDEDDGDAAAMAKPDRVKRRFTQAQRRRLATEGKALADGSYPIETPEDLHNAAVLARTGHGDVEGAQRLIARRAREMNMKNPLLAADKSTIGNPVDEAARKAMFNTASPYGDTDYASHGFRHRSPKGTPARARAIMAWARAAARTSPPTILTSARRNTSFDSVLATLRTVRGDRTAAEIGLAGFAQAGEVTVRQFDAAGQAGHYHDMQPVNPSPQRPDWHQARGFGHLAERRS